MPERLGYLATNVKIQSFIADIMSKGTTFNIHTGYSLTVHTEKFLRIKFKTLPSGKTQKHTKATNYGDGGEEGV